MKLLLDEMFPAAVAVALRARGHDVIAVQEDAALRRSSDEELFEIAQSLGRAVVTENVVDFLPLGARMQGRGHTHHGLVLTTNRSFPRHRSRVVGALTVALAVYLDDLGEGATPASVVHWLERPAIT